MFRDTLQDQHRTDERAVSPVIGVILMVSISVILSSVIGAFVLEIGDRQEVPPKGTVSMEQTRINISDCGDPNYSGGGGLDYWEGPRVVLSHTGGETVEKSNIRIIGDINTGVTAHMLEFEGKAPGNCDSYGQGGDLPVIKTGWNSQEEGDISAGDVSRVTMYYNVDKATEVAEWTETYTYWAQGVTRKNATKLVSGDVTCGFVIGPDWNGEKTPLTAEEWKDYENSKWSPEAVDFFIPGQDWGFPSCPFPAGAPYYQGDGYSSGGPQSVGGITAGDEVQVVWNSDSGGKSQILVSLDIE